MRIENNLSYYGKSRNRKLYKYLYLYIHMSKIITITDELYGKLKAMKKDDESFSKVIVRSINNKSNKNKVLELAGKRKDLDIDLRKIRKEWIWNRHV